MNSTEWETLVEMLRTSAGDEDAARLTAGEVAALITSAHGDLTRAATESGQEYKTLSERRKVITFYQSKSAVQIIPGESVARDLLAEFPTLRWKHLVMAKGLRNPDWALKTLMRRGIHMTVPQFARHLSRLHKRLNGLPDNAPIVLHNDDGVTVRIEGYASDDPVTLNGRGLNITIART